MKRYVAERRYDYVGIDLYDGEKCLRTIKTGIKPLKLGREFAELLQEAYRQGREDELTDADRDAAKQLIETAAAFESIKTMATNLLPSKRRELIEVLKRTVS